ncbi:conserved hypothetical protein [Talaromyces stipitatus ATCC 10500]|uniref:Zn(2)-C6 fungal-type domain-containing protein n=1 Tax=Talaromyces stipitatus (strain ATCC 10500 / CBS 375.48 / QM 6759 / NRRL 1006) TaxID=441959 RepID=B8MPF7_TALSN|nr:uncharacterized protein TSTA_106050 [Talaromyces stipitatus ATCC 10500]EED14396.1 conserved hypothetical protein [Talaromyces stipitatus ATCC 10500]
MLAHAPVVGRPYRSKRQKPCSACRRRRVCCVREGNSACALCSRRGLDCVVEPSTEKKKDASEKSRASKAPARNPSPRRDHFSVNTTIPSSARRVSEHIFQYVGPSGDYDPFILLHRSQEGAVREGVIHWAWQRVSKNSHYPIHFSGFPAEHLDASPTYYPQNKIEAVIGPYREALINAFFDVVHKSFPVLGPQTPLTIPNESTLMVSIYCLAQPYHPPAQCVDPWLFTDFNKQALPIETHTAKLETVEAALLFAQRHASLIRAPTMPGMSSEVGSLVGIGHDLGLNVDPEHWGISMSEKRRRRRLWWGIFNEDKWTAFALGRPSHLHDNDANVAMLKLSDFADEGSELPTPDNQAPAKVFIAMTELSVILADILSTFYTVKEIHAHPVIGLEQLENSCTEFEAKLETWRTGHLDPLIREKLFPDPTGSLELAFYAVQIALYRACVRIISHLEAQTVDLASRLRQRGMEIASSVVNLLEALSVSRRSAFWLAAGSFMIFMFLHSILDGENDYWMNKLSKYRTLLRAHLPGFGVTKHALIRLDLLASPANLSQCLTEHNSTSVSSGAVSKPITSTPQTSVDSWVYDHINSGREQASVDWLSLISAEWENDEGVL